VTSDWDLLTNAHLADFWQGSFVNGSWGRPVRGDSRPAGLRWCRPVRIKQRGRAGYRAGIAPGPRERRVAGRLDEPM